MNLRQSLQNILSEPMGAPLAPLRAGGEGQNTQTKRILRISDTQSEMLNPFSSITTAGLLLPLDLLTRVGSMDRALPGMTPADYHVPGSIRLNEAATAAYSRALAYWKSFRKKFNALPASDTGTTLTRDEWLLPLFECLGYGRLQNKRAITIDNKDFPISHGWEDHVSIHLLSARLPLDKRTQHVSGAATRSPYSLVQELLNRSSKHRWGFVSNGLKLYVLRDNASLTRSANVEFDLETMMDGEYHADFTVLFLICHQSRLEIQLTPIVDKKSSQKKVAKPVKATTTRRKIEDDDAEDDSRAELLGVEEAIEIEEPTRLGPENCWLEAWTKLADSQGIAAKEKLRFGVQLAIQTLGAGFYTCTSNAVLHESLRSGELSSQDYYRQLLRLVYRLLMLMVAEDKSTESGQNLLHPIDTPAHIRDRYNQFYSVGRIRKLANERRGTPHRDLYESLKTTFLKLRDGYAPLGIPGIGSFLFSDTATPDLDTAQITNEALLDAFRHLCFTDDATGCGGSIRRAVDFGNLGSEELGSIYESLLELHPEIDSQDGPFVLRTAAGNERKTSGSYYTPTSLINCLLDSALDPVVNQAIDVPDREDAKRRLLNLKVCDPACGSGHFLIAAANRMALHLARLETQDTEPTTLQIQHAKRQIIGRCIYGVDINEMAVELCKVSLWMETLEPGKPLSFLDHHIQCGNSLIGATPKLLAGGIPDDAFKPIEGDDKAVCSELKKRNKRELLDYKTGQGYLFEPVIKLGNLAGEFAKLTATEDDSLNSIAAKRSKYTELVKGTNYQNARLWADTWCAAFVWKKDESDLGWLCPTERKFRDIERSPHSVNPLVRAEIERLAGPMERGGYQFLHWHIAFPDVFQLPDAQSEPSNKEMGWNNGFDVVLGNPPWERIKLQEKEFFDSRHEKIANAQNSAARKKLINALPITDPQLWEQWTTASRFAQGISHIARNSGRFPLCGRGDINIYTLFTEHNWRSLAPTGRAGFIIPSGIATDDTTKDFFQAIISSGSLHSLWEFENEGFFTAGKGHMLRFALTTLAGSKTPAQAADFLFQGHAISDLDDPNRHFELTSEEIALINPNTGTCPIFRTKRDAEIAKKIYRHAGVLWREGDPDGNPWGLKFMAMFHMANDSSLFRTKAELRSAGWELQGNRFYQGERTLLPLYEAKMAYIYNHRSGTFEHAALGDRPHRLPLPSNQELSNPHYVVQPFYWVDETEVHAKLNDTWDREWLLGWRDVTDARASVRTVVTTLVPRVGVGHKLPLAFPNCSPALVACLFANLCSFALDYSARQKVGGLSLTYFIFKQLPTFSPTTFARTCKWNLSSYSDWIVKRVTELIYTSHDIGSFASDCGDEGGPYIWNPERRFQIQCELDAAFFHLYDLSHDDADHVMETFPVVRRNDERAFGCYRTKHRILEIYDQLAESARTGQPYVSPHGPAERASNVSI
jgi:hypothetical protein